VIGDAWIRDCTYSSSSVGVVGVVLDTAFAWAATNEDDDEVKEEEEKEEEGEGRKVKQAGSMSKMLSSTLKKKCRAWV
jgi:hypothetical protein